MKIGIFSDCHGNIQGLRRSYEMLKSRGAETFWCLGDIVGYGADSLRCIEFVREHCEINLAGNHDHALIEKMSMLHYQSYTIESIIVAKAQLKRDHLDWLKSLPLERTVEYPGVKVLLTHAHPKDYEAWSYFPDDPTFENLMEGEEDKVALCFYGHTHQPKFNLASQGGMFQTPDNFTAYSYSEQNGETIVINVGSCGQPRDSDTRVAGVLLDLKQKNFTFLRGEYPIESTQRSMREVGLSEFLVERLNYGR